ncbi:MAG: hypothetical protein ACE37J_19070 [Pikeienuella sp.]|uniref:hypothetical protein n=1 Tax=Pikeienuella sp. TaxID=2831957 RepID=UPI00391DBB28
MATFDLREIKDERGFVLHFGGRPHEVNTYVFANALVAISDVFREINSQVNIDRSIELRLEAVGPGSFRAKFRGVPKTFAGLIKQAFTLGIVPIAVTYIYNNYIDPSKFEIIVSDDYVIIQDGNDRIIIPKKEYEASQKLPNPSRVDEKFNKAIDAIEDDSSIESIGITANLDDEVPLVDLPRDTWARIRERRETETPEEGNREATENAHLYIVKAVFSGGRRKWEFAWRGIKISAYIEDQEFLGRIYSGEIKIGNGDSIECDLRISQMLTFPDRVWINKEYTVDFVHKFIPR